MAKVVRTKGPGFDKLNLALKGMDNIQTKVGWFETAKYEDGTPVAYVAAIHEHGYPAGGIPARPFVRPTIAEKKKKWKAFSLQAAQLVLAGTMKLGDAMDILGLSAAGDIAKKISSITTPPLKQSTIDARIRKRKKKSQTSSIAKPLVDTAMMVGSITSVTEKK